MTFRVTDVACVLTAKNLEYDIFGGSLEQAHMQSL